MLWGRPKLEAYESLDSTRPPPMRLVDNKIKNNSTCPAAAPGGPLESTSVRQTRRPSFSRCQAGPWTSREPSHPCLCHHSSSHSLEPAAGTPDHREIPGT